MVWVRPAEPDRHGARALAAGRRGRYDGMVIRNATRPILLTSILLAGIAAHHPAVAQVAVNSGALDRLTPSAAPPRPPPAGETRRTERKHSNTKPVTKTGKTPVATPTATLAAKPQTKPPIKPAAPRPPPVAVAPAPPPPAAIAASVTAPPKPVPAIPIPVLADAIGDASPIPGGVRVTFGPDKSDLNPSTEAALRNLARTLGGNPTVTFNVHAYANGLPDDPSTPRRLSLSRALAVRAVLMSEGVVSTRIYVRALGATALAGQPDGPPDRVDVTQTGFVAPAASSPTQP